MLESNCGKDVCRCEEDQSPVAGCHPHDVLPWYDLQALLQASRGIQVRMRARYGCGESPSGNLQIATIAGADAAYRGWFGTGVVVVLTFPDLHPLCHAYATRPVTIPYLPGFFGIRELPVLMAAFEKLPLLPDLLLLDGQGFAHPRRFGSACQGGAVLGIPSIGVARNTLIGEFPLPGHARGSASEVTDGGEVIGMAVRTKTGARPVFVSAGYQTDLRCAVRITMATTQRHRVPEPIRMADILARQYHNHFFPK